MIQGYWHYHKTCCCNEEAAENLAGVALLAVEGDSKCVIFGRLASLKFQTFCMYSSTKGTN